MKRLREALKWFLYITTGILFVVALSYSLAGEENVPTIGLWYILLAGLLTTIVTMILAPTEEEKQAVIGVKMILHYVVLCVVMTILGIVFGWMTFSLEGVIMMCIDVAIVYVISFFAYCIVDRKQADAINKRLKEKYGDEE